MDDLIRRKDAIDACFDPRVASIYDISDLIEMLPSVELPIKEKCCVCPHCDNCDVNEDGTIERSIKNGKPKFTQVVINTDVYWLERQLDMYKERIYLNEQTMIVYVPFVTAELVEACGGTFKRVGEEE